MSEHKKTGVPIAGFPGMLYSSSSSQGRISLSRSVREIQSTISSKVMFDRVANSPISSMILLIHIFTSCGERSPLSPFEY